MKLIVNPHKIEIDKSPVNEREIDITKCEFEFTDEITNDYVKEAYFTFDGTSYKEIIVNNQCAIPSEVLAEKGQVEIGVVAFLVENEEEIKRYNPSPAYFNTWLGSLKDNVENSEPITPSEMEQYEQALNDGLAEVNDKLDEIDQAINDVTTAITETNNLDLDVSKEGKTATVTLTKKDATTKVVTLSDGTSLMFNWQGTSLGIKTDDDTDYTYVDLQGIQGEQGEMGAPFTIKKTYSSVAEMNADFNNMQIGDYVMIASTVEVEDNAKLYTRGEEQWIFISDFSGATGIKGETGATPNIQIGTVTSGTTPSVTRSGTNENPILNFVLVKGDKGDTGQTGSTGATGNGIASITKTGTVDTVDTYTITYTNGTTSTFTVTNGEVSQAQLDTVQMELDKYKTLSKLLPKVEGEGSSVTLSNTVEGVTMDIIPEGATSQYTTTGNNIWNILGGFSGGTISTNDDKNYSMHSTTTTRTISVNAEANTAYTCSLTIEGNSGGADIYFAFEYSDDTTSSFGGSGSASSRRIIATSNSSKTLTGIVISTYNVTLLKDYTITEPVIVKGTYTTSDLPSYEPYTNGASPNSDYPQKVKVVTGDNSIVIQNQDNTQQQTYPINLGSLELAKIGNYQDYIYGSPNNWYVHKETSKVDFSNLTWVTTYNIGGGYRLCGTTDITDIKHASVNTEIIPSYAEKYIVRQGSRLSNSAYRYYMAVDVSRVVVHIETAIKPTGLYYYPLATPTDTQITDTTLITQLNNLYNATSQEGTTYITCSSASDDNETLQVKVSTYKDISAILNPTETSQSL